MAHGGKMWSLSGPQLHSEGSWLAHSLWRWNRKWQQAWNHATAWRSVFTITVYNFCHNVRHILTVVWHHEQVFPCKPLIFFWHLSHFPDSQFPLTQSWVEIWGEKHTRNNKIITSYYKYSILDSYTKEKQDQTSRVLERSHPIQLSRSQSFSSPQQPQQNSETSERITKSILLNICLYVPHILLMNNRSLFQSYITNWMNRGSENFPPTSLFNNVVFVSRSWKIPLLNPSPCFMPVWFIYILVLCFKMRNMIVLISD